MNRLIAKVSNKNLVERKEKPFLGAFRCRVAHEPSSFEADIKVLLSLWLPKYI